MRSEHETSQARDWSEYANNAVKACETAAKLRTPEACAEAAALSWAVAEMVPECLMETKKGWASGAAYWQRCAAAGKLI